MYVCTVHLCVVYVLYISVLRCVHLRVVYVLYISVYTVHTYSMYRTVQYVQLVVCTVCTIYLMYVCTHLYCIYTFTNSAVALYVRALNLGGHGLGQL